MDHTIYAILYGPYYKRNIIYPYYACYSCEVIRLWYFERLNLTKGPTISPRVSPKWVCPLSGSHLYDTVTSKIAVIRYNNPLLKSIKRMAL